MLITDPYRELNRRLHAGGKFGRNGDKWAAEVAAIAAREQLHDLLDYGCGQGALCRALRDLAPGLALREYDPAIAGKEQPPAPAEFVVCTDVIEHVEPDCLASVLDDLQRVSRKWLFAVVSTRPAKKLLEDGRNAHLIVQPESFWRPQFVARFHIERWQVLDDEIVTLLRSTGGG